MTAVEEEMDWIGLEGGPQALPFVDAEVLDTPSHGMVLVVKSEGKEARFLLSERRALFLRKGLDAALVRRWEHHWS